MAPGPKRVEDIKQELYFTFCANPECDGDLKMVGGGHLHPKLAPSSLDNYNPSGMTRTSKPSEPSDWEARIREFIKDWQSCVEPEERGDTVYNLVCDIEDIERTAEERGYKNAVAAQTPCEAHRMEFEAKARADERKRIQERLEAWFIRGVPFQEIIDRLTSEE